MRLLLITLFLTIAAICPALAQDWDIQNYNVDITLAQDGKMKVIEDIQVNFAGPHHGIYRLVTLRYKDRLGQRFSYRFAFDSATDENGRPYRVSLSRQGEYNKIKIGDPNQTFTGPMHYRITYTLDRGIQFFDHRPELYWNPIGQEWEVPIRAASCTVHLPADVKLDSGNCNVWTGALGSKESAATISMGSPKDVTFTATREFNPLEGMTIWIGLPQGIIAEPQKNQRALWFLGDNGMWLIPILVLALYIWLVRTKGRDPYAERSVAVTYDPPDNMIPAEVGTVIDESADIREITGTMIDLAARGYIRIEAIEEKILLFTKRDYKLVKLKEPDDLSPFEIALMSAVFEGGATRLISDMKNHFYTRLPGLKQKLYQQVVQKGYFERSPDSVRGTYIGIGVVIAILTVVVGATTQSFMWGGALGVSALIAFIFAPRMPRKTMKGAQALVGIKGFEEYLQRAEREDILRQEKQGLFERYLPYAIVLNVADQWARAFDGIATEPPSWYVGAGSWTHFSASSFAHDMGSATREMGSSFSSSPSSSGGGGGGSSGGGGGGGGGGAW